MSFSKLHFIHIIKNFNGRCILNNICGSFSTGITGILGTNGSGKTTLMRILAGLLPAEGGGIVLNKTPIKTESSSWRDLIGYLPQSPGLYERMTIWNYLDYMLLLSRWSKKTKRHNRIDKIINQLNLYDYKDHPIGHVSGGTRQRVAIGQALIHNPDIIMLDEPTNNLDVEERIRFHNLLLTEYKDTIIIYIDHVINELVMLTSELLLIHDTRIQFKGSPDELIQSVKGRVKEILVSEKEYKSRVHDKLRVLKIVQQDKNLLIKYDSFFSDDPEGIEVNPSLEEAYLTFIK